MGKKKGSGRKKNDDSLIVGIAIGYVAAVIVMNSGQPPIRIKVPTPALPNTTSTGGAQLRRMPRINRRPWSTQNPLFYMAY